MESANRREGISQRLTVAPFESLTEFFDCFADDLFGLLYFHDCSPVSGASCPLHQTARGQGPETENGAKRLVRPGRNGSHARVTQNVVARHVLVETGGVGAYSPGRGNLKAAKEEGKRLRGMFAS